MIRPVLLVLAIAACSRREHPAATSDDRQPRQLDPPPQNVRALPPHAIRADGVGPYRLGVSLEQLANQVPSGARNALDEIPNVVHLSVLHAEDDAILIGGEPLGRATFIAVVGSTIARTESGVHVGSTRDELAAALGPAVVDVDRARDPRLIVPDKLRELRAVVDGDRVIGLVVAAAEPIAKDVDACVRPPLAADDSLRARTRFTACMTAGGDVVTVDGDDVVVRTAEGDRPIAMTRLPLAGASLVFAAPLRGPDGHDEIVAIARSDDNQSRTWTLYAYRFEGTRLVRATEPTPIFQVTPANARTIGAELRDLDLVLELAARPDVIEVGGLLTSRHGDVVRDLVVVSPVQVPRRHVKSPPTEVDAGIPDAGDGGSTQP